MFLPSVPPSPRDIWTHHTPVVVRSALAPAPVPGAQPAAAGAAAAAPAAAPAAAAAAAAAPNQQQFVVVVVGDNTEIEVDRSAWYPLKYACWSHKAKADTVKLMLLVASDGYVLANAFARGGRASETACADALVRDGPLHGRQSVYTQLANHRESAKVVLLLDRGFRGEEFAERHGEATLLIPPQKPKNRTFTASELSVAQALSAVRVIVERVNHHVLKVMESLERNESNSMLLFDLRVKIALAMGNCTYENAAISLNTLTSVVMYSASHLAGKNVSPYPLRVPSPADQRDALIREARAAAQMFVELLRPASADDPVMPALPPIVAPAGERAAQWTAAVQRFPDANEWRRRLRKQQHLNFLRIVPDDNDEVFDQPVALLAGIPERRAMGLVEADYVRHVQFRVADDEIECFFDVRASFRDQQHCTVMAWSSSSNMFKTCCSCEKGASRVCAHVQAACVVMEQVKRQERPVAWSAEPLGVQLDVSQPVARLYVMKRERKDVPVRPLVVHPLPRAPGESVESLVERARVPRDEKAWACWFCTRYSIARATRHIVNHVEQEHADAYAARVPANVRQRLGNKQIALRQDDLALILQPNPRARPAAAPPLAAAALKQAPPPAPPAPAAAPAPPPPPPPLPMEAVAPPDAPAAVADLQLEQSQRNEGRERERQRRRQHLRPAEHVEEDGDEHNRPRRATRPRLDPDAAVLTSNSEAEEGR